MNKLVARINLPLVVISALATITGLSGCSNGPKAEDIAKLQQENASLKADLAALKQEVEGHSKEVDQARTAVADIKAQGGDATSTTGDTTSTNSSSEATPSASTATFTDIAGVFGEKEIKKLTDLKVIDNGPTFEPTKPVTRAQFVDWLVKANNVIKPKNYQIRKAEKNAKPAFTDVPATNPYFAAIQGMSDAGWSIGFTDKTFRPDQNLTREQLIAIKAPLDHQQKDLSDYLDKWQDRAKIGKDFKTSMNLEAFAGHNWERIFGATKNCDPQKPVSRAEAAVCASQFYTNQEEYSADNPQGSK